MNGKSSDRRNVPDQCADLANRLAAALAIPTVSYTGSEAGEEQCFAKLHQFLEENYPLVHAALAKEQIGSKHALLYTWQGTDKAAKPWLFSAHQDVVPVEKNTESQWTHPPFDGHIADGFVWGRGAMDLKVSLVAAFEAAEQLLREGFRPKRTVFFAFGADEEVGGEFGAQEIAARLRSSGVRLAFTLDEGGMVVSDLIPGLDRPAALIGIAEKGEALLRLRVEGAGGHGSLPGATSPIGRLAHAIASIEDHPMTARFDPPISDTSSSIAPFARRPYRTIYQNHRLFAPLLPPLLRAEPVAAAAVRTTIVPTMVFGGVAENVIPRSATAILNVRLKPGNSIAEVESHVRKLVYPFGVTLEVLQGWPASRISSTESGAFRVLCSTINEVIPDAVAAPYLALSASDSRHYEPIAQDQYRFVPIRVTPADLQRIHGVDERVSISNYAEIVQFFSKFIRNADQV